jgi:hypothetical protein
MFAGKREQVEELYRTFPHYAEASHAQDAIEYFEEFWEVIDNPRRFEDRIVDDCTPMPR